MRNSGPVSLNEAEKLAISALGYIAADPDHLARFLSLTGIDPASIRQLAASRGLLASVLEHVMTDESLLLAFCANAGTDPARIAPAAARLSGAGTDAPAE